MRRGDAKFMRHLGAEAAELWPQNLSVVIDFVHYIDTFSYKGGVCIPALNSKI